MLLLKYIHFSMLYKLGLYYNKQCFKLEDDLKEL